MPDATGEGDPVSNREADYRLVGAEELTLLGGRADDFAGLREVFDWCGARMAEADVWRSVEWTHRMRLEGVEGCEPPPDPTRFVWGRWFGPNGDLEVRREGRAYAWRFVGPAGRDGDERPAGMRSYFGAGPDVTAEEPTNVDGPSVRSGLREGPVRTAHLWHPPKDPEVAGTPPETLSLLRDGDGRLGLRFRAYYDRGVVAAVWYREIVPLAGDPASGGTSGLSKG